ncbi:dihydrofolate reductase family protein [Nocardia abscessus]|uniref:Dihydrofolate reductase family protein n=2 Tax=Nocardiaceae TaxID=85025 RepID=A0ABS0CEN7_9NOCA|nr:MULTISPECIES: dihydrofolate reductase family protein [Nocardia]MBF6222506.1 dihydrofolate reductase family protein [Nocardia abscessus]MBF6228789.1 dihydrofolate reductase family protein [Nocardia abscessus]
MRRIIAAMKTSIDGKIEGSQGYADWVDGWSDDYDLTSQVDACVLGGRMYPGYEQYWTTIQNQPDEVHPQSGSVPTPGEIEWAQVARRTPHYVVSNTLTSAAWSNTKFLRGLDELAALKLDSGKDIYLMGGAAITASAIDAGLVDELRLIVYPLIAGEGTGLFATSEKRRAVELRNVEQLPDGRLGLIYEIGRD